MRRRRRRRRRRIHNFAVEQREVLKVRAPFVGFHSTSKSIDLSERHFIECAT